MNAPVTTNNSFQSAGQGKTPFVATHRRRQDGLLAMLLGVRDGEALYRVQWFDNGKRHENTLSRSEDKFRRLFERVPA
jgi:hypothetical protein